jgi:large subunit ribosomal protein L15
MNILSQLTKPRGQRKIQRVGRGPGSGRGKTSCRGQKGQGARSGARKRYGYEGGQKRLYTKLPCRGFTRGMFIKESLAINFDRIDMLYKDGEVVNHQTLREKGCAPRELPGGLKILSRGEITKKVSIEANGFSKAALKKLDEKKISYKILEKKVKNK